MRTLLAAVLLAATGVQAQPALSSAYVEARTDAKSSRAAYAEAERTAAVRATAAFVPAMCAVESWCLAKATECFLGRTEQPTGLWKSYAQYSVVRRVRALCPTGAYGAWESRVFMGPVEPQVFSSEIETTEEAAVASALKLCRVYRQDWVSAAPACPAN